MPCRFDIFISRLETSRSAAKTQSNAISDQNRTRRDQREVHSGPAQPCAKKNGAKNRDNKNRS
jgi:hypothetical protein